MTAKHTDTADMPATAAEAARRPVFGTTGYRRLPALLALTYALAGALWIAGSDHLVNSLPLSAQQVAILQTYKGWFYVGLTAILLYSVLCMTGRRICLHQAQLRHYGERLELALSATSSGVWEWHLDSRTLVLSPQLKTLLGFPNDATLPTDILRQRMHPDDRERATATMRRMLHRPFTEQADQYRLRHSDGHYCWVGMRGRVICDANDVPTCLIGVATDITHSKEADVRIQQLIHFDALTGLPNRAMFIEKLREMSTGPLLKDEQVLVARFNIERFREINNELGMRAGDLLLRKMARRLERGTGALGVVARVGPDDFGVVVRGLIGNATTQQLAERLSLAVNKPYRLNGEAVHLRVTMGVTVFPADAAAPETLLSDAELALGRAREQGHHPVEFYAAGMNESYRLRSMLTRDLRQACERGELLLHYQPIFSARDQALQGFEALMRWRHRQLGMVPPSTFIPLAEDIGMIGTLGNWALHEASRQVAQWNQMAGTTLMVAVNVSPLQTQTNNFIDQVAAVLSHTGLSPQCLELEVTESALMADPVAAADRLRQLRALGVRVAIDDFGTGYSSLAVLKQLPVSKLKIDRAFVNDLDGNGEGVPIVTTIIDLARSLQLTVTAEGVETATQLDFLRDHGCDTVQGFLLGKPLPADQAEHLLPRPGAPRTAIAAKTR